jgi:hypothetical protein
MVFLLFLKIIVCFHSEGKVFKTPAMDPFFLKTFSLELTSIMIPILNFPW